MTILIMVGPEVSFVVGLRPAYYPKSALLRSLVYRLCIEGSYLNAIHRRLRGYPKHRILLCIVRISRTAAEEDRACALCQP
jgi:hypothetical protein